MPQPSTTFDVSRCTPKIRPNWVHSQIAPKLRPKEGGVRLQSLEIHLGEIWAPTELTYPPTLWLCRSGQRVRQAMGGGLPPPTPSAGTFWEHFGRCAKFYVFWAKFERQPSFEEPRVISVGEQISPKPHPISVSTQITPKRRFFPETLGPYHASDIAQIAPKCELRPKEGGSPPVPRNPLGRNLGAD